MRLLILLFTAVASLSAQLTPTALSFSQRQRGAPPYLQDIVVTGTGAATVNSCANVSGVLCSYLQTNTTDIAGTVHVFWDGHNTTLAPGSYQSTLSITRAGGTCAVSCTGTVNLTVHALTAPVFPTSEASCTNTNAIFLGNDTCPIANARPGGTFTQPTLANSTTDSTFGGIYRRVANDPSNSIGSDSITSPINSVGGLIQIVSTAGGATTLRDTTTGASTYSITPPANRAMSWDPRNPNIYYYLDASTPTVHKVVLPGQTDTVVATYTPVVSATDLTNGGDGEVTNDGWWCAYTEGGTDKRVVAVNLDDGTVTSFDFSGIVTMSQPPRQCTISALDTTSNVHYMILTSNPVSSGFGGGSNNIFTVASNGTITNLGPEPLSPMAASLGNVYKVIPTLAADCLTGYCRAAEHGNVFAQVDGELYWGVIYGVQVEGYVSWDFVHMNSVLASMESMEVDVESGGARTYTFPLNLNTASIHSGCASSASACVLGTDAVPLTAYQITNVSTGGTTTITTSPNYGGSNADVVLINGCLGVTGMSGPTLCTVSNLSGDHFDCMGLTTSGTYTSSTGSLTLNATPPAAPYSTDLIIYDLRGIASGSGGIVATRKLETRSFPYNGDRIGSNYFGQPHPGISADGLTVCWESNNGIPDNVGVFCAPTNFGPTATTWEGLFTVTGLVNVN